ncbi:phosphopantetheine-binding protein [[Clostridium] polysaccharolyticum]|uniref:Acyl carrier protein n=1 Tax=[Clostridium] polysaccharolyticum TaxID=29364 RepID=A0A1I0EEW5_9FIRM|nr:phosphopantetheine-binding protein [[Clostridium] polysaccharolyticum]SET43348.1 acyl carrier protein [[Clostridium] polysaccharolyticum]
MKEITEEMKKELKEMVYEFIAEECEVQKEELNDETSITDDLDGDSLLLVELIELAKKKYDLDIKLQTIGKYLLKNEADTMKEIVDVFIKIYQYEDAIVDLDA